MVKVIAIIFSIFTLTALAQDRLSLQQQNDYSEIIINTIYEELYKRTKDLRPTIKSKKSDASINQGRRGKLVLERIKQRNRERIALMHGHDPSKVKKGKDLVKLQIKENKAVLKKMKAAEINAKENLQLSEDQKQDHLWQVQVKMEIDNIRRKVIQEHKLWKTKHKKKLAELYKNKLAFNKVKDNYKDTLADIPVILPVSKSELNKKVEVKLEKESFLVNSALLPEIRDQKYRPTCSSFAGVKAIEILLSQKNNYKNLSEQYFYWASKPNCQKSKCSKKGSWVGNGLTFSKDSNSYDIPTEKNCTYNEYSLEANETQLPLTQTCKSGITKIKKFIYQATLDEALVSLKQNKPVVASITLSPNFYDNKGLILQSESNIGGKLDGHAQGHAVALIGYLKLPRILNEGSVCFIVANSWGQGWGQGGYSCLSEKWLLNHRTTNPFVIIQEVSSR
ncbi:MAG: C1 family peptidase [Halobacteriovoraceae bacterium]|jgi:C1A family cysteine protease|nr:C1 family peptidase [Halobacteriovoraceae bacterium]